MKRASGNVQQPPDHWDVARTMTTTNVFVPRRNSCKRRSIHQSAFAPAEGPIKDEDAV